MHLVTFERLGSRSSTRAKGKGLIAGAVGLEALPPGCLSAPCLGAIIASGANAGWVIDLNRILAIKLAYDDVGFPEAEADSLVPHDMLTFLKLGRPARLAARVAINFAIDALDRYDAPDLMQAGVVDPPSEIRLCAPVQHPGKIIGVANGYSSTGPQSSADSNSTEPCFFLKAPSAVIGANDKIKLPAAPRHVDFAGTLAAIIGTRAHDVSESEALDLVSGYCVANDVTARDLIADDYAIGKSCDTFLPLGPALVTPDEIPDPQALEIRSVLSGNALQRSTTKEMRFSVAKLISSASKIMTLDPGDVILTGTPSGTGADQQPQRWLQDGDIVEIEIDVLGKLTNYVAKA